LLEQLQPLSADAVLEKHETGSVAAWPRQAVDEARRDRISDDREYDRHGMGCLQQLPHGVAAVSQDDVRRKPHHFRSVFADVGIGRGPTCIDPHIAADALAQLRQFLQERPDPRLVLWIFRGCWQEHANTTHAFALLGLRDQRPRRRRAANKRDELAPPHHRAPS